MQQVRPFRIRRLETPAQQRALRSRQSDPVSRPARRLQNADAEPPDRAPCRYAARIVPDADFPVGQRGGCQRPSFVGNQHGSAGGHAARVPEPGPFAEQFRTVRRDADFVAALAEVAACVGFPTEMRTGGVDGERIGQVFASQLLRAHGLLGAAAGEQQQARRAAESSGFHHNRVGSFAGVKAAGGFRATSLRKIPGICKSAGPERRIRMPCRTACGFPAAVRLSPAGCGGYPTGYGLWSGLRTELPGPCGRRRSAAGRCLSPRNIRMKKINRIVGGFGFCTYICTNKIVKYKC